MEAVMLRLFSNPYYFRFNTDLEMNVDMNYDKTIERVHSTLRNYDFAREESSLNCRM